MSDWQKVKVTFTDASGEEVSAVMYEERFSQYAMPGDYYADQNGNGAMIGAGEHVTVTPIRELPTGLGAVVSVEYGLPINDVENYVYMGDDWWGTRDAKDIRSENLAELKFTVLSEGIEL